MIDGVVPAASEEPSVFIVKYNYNPSEMSPNPNHEAELTLVAGDYIYVFGEMDGDGFYHAQLTTGEEGLVPSNFIELVEQGEGTFTCVHHSTAEGTSLVACDYPRLQAQPPNLLICCTRLACDCVVCILAFYVSSFPMKF